MSVLSQLFGGGGGPSGEDAANQYLSQIPGVLTGQLGPFAEAGRGAIPVLTGEYGKLMGDPSGFINALMGGYKPSEGYQARQKEGLRSAANVAAAGGFRGTPSDVRQQADIVNQLMAQDQQQYLQNVLGAYGTGLAGEQNLLGLGAQTAGQLGGGLAQNLTQQGGLAFQQAQQKQQQRGSLLNALLGLGGTIGGAALLGPMGGALGSKLFGTPTKS
jgi:hypothetical protein